MQHVTIQIVTWNSAAALRESLPFLRDIDPMIAGLKIIDNASNDETVALVRQHLPQAEILALPDNNGFAGGHNEGFNSCTTPYVLVLNPDVKLNWAGVVGALQYFQDPKIGAIQGKLFRHDKIIDSAGIRMTLAFNGKDLGAGEIDAGQYDQNGQISAVTGASALYRLTALRDVAHDDREIFDQDFLAYKEDVDLSWRLRRKGWKIMYVALNFGIHERVLKSHGRFGWPLGWTTVFFRLRDPRTALSWRNWLWTIVKNASLGELILYSPWWLGRLAMLILLSLLHWPLLLVWGAALRGMPRMIAKRQPSL